MVSTLRGLGSERWGRVGMEINVGWPCLERAHCLRETVSKQVVTERENPAECWRGMREEVTEAA